MVLKHSILPSGQLPDFFWCVYGGGWGGGVGVQIGNILGPFMFTRG